MISYPRYVFMFAAVVSLSACSSSPTAPTQHGPLSILCSGQSNALWLCTGSPDHLESFWIPYGTVRGDYASGAPISLWDADGQYWERLKAVLPGAPVDAFVWWQGETDGLRGISDGVYGSKLDGLIKRVREALNTPRLLVVVVEMGQGVPNGPVQRETLSWTQRDAHAVYIRTSGLEYMGDGVHMTANGYLGVATRIANAIVSER